MEIFIIFMAWFLIGFVILINYASSEEFIKNSRRANLIILFAFLPTTLFVYILSIISNFINKLVEKKDE